MTLSKKRKTAKQVTILVTDMNDIPPIVYPFKTFLDKMGLTVKININRNYKSTNKYQEMYFLIVKNCTDDITNNKIRPISILSPCFDFDSNDDVFIAYPVINISNEANNVLSQLSNCMWVVNSNKAQQKLEPILKVKSEKFIILKSSDERIAYHIALSLITTYTSSLRMFAYNIVNDIIGNEHDTLNKVKETIRNLLKEEVDINNENHVLGSIANGNLSIVNKHFKLLGDRVPQYYSFYKALASASIESYYKSKDIFTLNVESHVLWAWS